MHQRKIPLFLRVELVQHVLDALDDALLHHLLGFGLELLAAL